MIGEFKSKNETRILGSNWIKALELKREDLRKSVQFTKEGNKIIKTGKSANYDEM